MRRGARRVLLRGLAALEYRGYDSAGMAFIGKDENALHRVAVVGRVGKLKTLSGDGLVGIGHTRWATHGAPTLHNAHPIIAGQAAVVHNGIIENHASLRDELCAAGRVFQTETDTEVIAHLLDMALADNDNLTDAVRTAAAKLEGAFAVAAVAAGHRTIMFMRRGAPLMLGYGKNGICLASDAQALEGFADRLCYLEDGDCGVLQPPTKPHDKTAASIVDADGQSVNREWQPFPIGVSVASLGEHRHFMQKEIFEQPLTAAAALSPYLSDNEIKMRRFGKNAAKSFRQPGGVLILACGTSYHAGLAAQHWFHQLSVPCRVEIASEYRYSADPLAAKTLTVAVSQSGETADTLSAMRAAKNAGAPVMALVNTPQSTMAREADFVMHLNAGPEIGVASTKCFLSQLVQLLMLSLAVAKARRQLPPDTEKNAAAALRGLPHLIRRALQLEGGLQTWAHTFAAAKSALFIGRRAHRALALEGALKLKEISYIHAEGCAAGELKHGTLALVDEHVPVVGLLPNDEVAAKMESNLSEAAARGARLFVLCGGDVRCTLPAAQVLRIEEDPAHAFWTSPMVFAPPLQLLAYHTALEKGTDIDKPRNLAKSVTVE